MRKRVAAILSAVLLLSQPLSAAQTVRSEDFPAIAEKLEQKSNVQRYRAFKAIFDPKGPVRFSAPTLTQRLRLYEKALVDALLHSDRELGRIIGRWGRRHGLAAGYTGVWQGVSWPFFSFSQSLGVHAAAAIARGAPKEAWPPSRVVDPDAERRIVRFLRSNTTPDGMPLSYKVPDSYWTTYKPLMDPVDSVLERLLLKYGLSIYDAALWQIALLIAGDESDRRRVDAHTARLLSGSSGELKEIRAHGPEFLYGESRAVLDRSEAFFFRIIADRYMQDDPITGSAPVPGFPNFETPHHEDWKPITGEQAWAAIIGLLQAAFLKNAGQISSDAPELRLALDILPAIEAMQSRIGALYHVPAGTRGKYPNEISVENNCSIYGALKMLRGVVSASHPEEAARIDKVLSRMEAFFAEHAFDPVSGVFVQGGFLDEQGFHPSQIFAADCQTWAILALGPAWIDGRFGEGTAFRLWENTRFRAGYVDPDGVLRGIGFSDGHGIYSVEWTCGAIAAVRRLRDYYLAGRPDRAQYLAEDIVLMREGVERFRVSAGPGADAYLYSNKRYFIQFGWWANPVPSLAATAWALLVDRGFDPFVLGGGPRFGPDPDRKPEG